MATLPRILVVGGYGHVGGMIAARLAAGGGMAVRVAGRDAGKAAALAARLGCEGVRVDPGVAATWDAALDGVDTVVACIDQHDTAFVAHVLGRGLAYVDITANDAFLREVEALDAVARAHGGRALLSVGLAPGLTNLLVRACAEAMDTAASARIGVMLGPGDAHGDAAIDWTLRAFALLAPGPLPLESIGFGTPPRPYTALRFGFADQHVVRRTLGLAEARTLLAFAAPLPGGLLFPLLRRIAGTPALAAVARRAMARIRLGSDRTALAVEVTGTSGGRPAMRRAALEGRREAEITALVAAIAVRHLHRSPPPPGVRHIEQALSVAALAPELAAHGIALDLPGADAENREEPS